jgi:hypothetical protein
LSIGVITTQISTTCLYSGTRTSAFGFIARNVSAQANARDFSFQSAWILLLFHCHGIATGQDRARSSEDHFRFELA